jgi:hypothetical protein
MSRRAGRCRKKRCRKVQEGAGKKGAERCRKVQEVARVYDGVGE